MRIIRILLIGVAGLLVLVIAVVVAITFTFGGAAERGVERVGQRLMKVDVALEDVSVSPFSGSGKLEGLVVGNPEGFKTPNAIKVGTATMTLQPRSLFSDKVIVNSINVQAPEITFETDLRGNNLSKIMANLEKSTGAPGETTPEEEQTQIEKKFQVNEFVVTGGKINVSVTALGGKAVTVPMPDIHLKDLGTGPEGITASELTEVLLQEVLKSATKVASDAASNLAKGAVSGVAEEASKAATEAISEGIGGLFKKKK